MALKILVELVDITFLYPSNFDIMNSTDTEFVNHTLLRHKQLKQHCDRTSTNIYRNTKKVKVKRI